jgi:transcriptional regulator with GAF, ATPase, and Fis domain
VSTDKFENRRHERQNAIHLSADRESGRDGVVNPIQGNRGPARIAARALHCNSPRQHHPFVTINCSALPDNMLESELFGYKKGLAGAVMDKIGLYEEQQWHAFLDEINSMSQQLQTKLFRFWRSVKSAR